MDQGEAGVTAVEFGEHAGRTGAQPPGGRVDELELPLQPYGGTLGFFEVDGHAARLVSIFAVHRWSAVTPEGVNSCSDGRIP